MGAEDEKNGGLADRSADEGSSTNIEEIACAGYRRSYAKQ